MPRRPRPRLTHAKLEIVENIAQMQIRYETIFTEQLRVLRTDKAKYYEAAARLRQSSFVAKDGQDWEPTDDEADEYVAKCDEICRSVPRDFDDRVKILFAAHGALICVSTVKQRKLREKVQLEIIRRHNEISLTVPILSSPEEPVHERPISKPLADPRQITVEELQLFQRPDNLHGKQFILSPDSDESRMYEVIGYARKRDKTVTYDVLFDNREDPISVDVNEMMGMLQESLYFPA